MADPIVIPPDTWQWAPVELHANDPVLEFAIKTLTSERLEEVDTDVLGPDYMELDTFAAAILGVENINSLCRIEEDGTLMVYTLDEYVYFERNHGDIAGIIRRRL